jgi:uncharacterized protein YciI
LTLVQTGSPDERGITASNVELIPMKYFALIYQVVDDYVARRAPFRDEHLALARELQSRGELLMGGAMGDPVDGALLIFRAPDVSIIEDFVRRDPYVVNRLVTQWEIRPWHVVIGNE